jgi:galactoside O-acetyltransferase
MSRDQQAARTSRTSYYADDELASLGLRRWGRDVRISRYCCIYSPETIEIGDHVRIDDFSIVSGRITLGSYVHVAAYVALYGRAGITVGDFAGISARTLVYSTSDDFSGDHLAGPTIPDAHRAVVAAPVEIGRFAIIGAGSVILPGVTVHEGAAIGAMSLVRDDAPAWTVTVGVPGRPIKPRSRGMVRRAAELGEVGPEAAAARS